MRTTSRSTGGDTRSGITRFVTVNSPGERTLTRAVSERASNRVALSFGRIARIWAMLAYAPPTGYAATSTSKAKLRVSAGIFDRVHTSIESAIGSATSLSHSSDDPGTYTSPFGSVSVSVMASPSGAFGKGMTRSKRTRSPTPTAGFPVESRGTIAGSGSTSTSRRLRRERSAERLPTCERFT